MLHYFQGTIDMILFYSNKSNFDLVGFTDFEYLFDPHKTRFQIGNLFTYEGTAIS